MTEFSENLGIVNREKAQVNIAARKVFSNIL